MNLSFNPMVAASPSLQTPFCFAAVTMASRKIAPQKLPSSGIGVPVLAREIPRSPSPFNLNPKPSIILVPFPRPNYA